MGSTATSKAVKKTATKVKKDSGTKKSARKAAPKKAKSRTTPVKKKTAVRKKAAVPKKATRKKTVAKKKAPRKKAATKAGTRSVQSPGRHADVTAVTGTTPNTTDTTATDTVQGDGKSLSWMAAQAASALKAVRANQNARAQDLLAKAEIKQDKQAETTPTPVKAEAKIPAEPDVHETKKDKKIDTTPKPVEAVVKQVTKASPAVVPAEQAAPDKTPLAQSAPAAPEPNKQGTVKAAASRAAPAQPEVTENAVKIQHETPPAHVIAATSKAPGNRRSKRLILSTGIIVLAGILGTRAWFSDNDTADIAAVQDSAGTEQVSPVNAKPPIAKPSIEVITRVANEPTVKPATAATQTNRGAPTTHPAGPEPAGTLETLPTVAATSPETSADEAVATETPQQQAIPQTTAAAPQATNPVAPRPGYYAPAYDYYRQQPVRQQQYYRPGYSR